MSSLTSGQIRQGRGSRVLLRCDSSLGGGKRGGSRDDVQFAADVAAFYSEARAEQLVEVMFTDSRKVAKKGSRVGQMKDKKKLGVVNGYPEEVAGVAREAQAKQG